MIFSDSINEKISNLINQHQSHCDYLEIRLEKNDTDFINLDQDGVSDLFKKEKIGGCIRACYKGGWGFTCFADFSQLNEMTRNAVQIARSTGRGKTRLAEVQPIVDKVELKLIHDPREISLDDKVQLLMKYQNVMKSYSPDKMKNFNLNYSNDFIMKNFMNSEGTHIQQEFAMMDMFYCAVVVNNGEQTMVYDVVNSNNDYNVFYNQEPFIEEICRNSIEFSSAGKVKPGKYTMILDPQIAATLAHETFGHQSEADIYATSKGGTDAFEINRKYGSDCLTLYDTGLKTGNTGYMKYDDEGVPTEKTMLLENGVLKGRLHNRETAGILKEKPTGNARALNYQYPPIVRMRNTCIEPGTSTFKDLIGDISIGVLAISLYGGSGGQNFSFTPNRGFMIRNGQLAEPVKNFTLSGNLFSTLFNVEGVSQSCDFKCIAGSRLGCGKDSQFGLPVGMSAPFVRIADFTVN